MLKNIIAIAVGMGDGLGAGDNTRAALITRGLAEMSRLGEALGGKAETFAGLAGMGDMIATCTSPQSRNRHVGMELAKGRSIDDIIDTMHMVAEGEKRAHCDRPCAREGDQFANQRGRLSRHHWRVERARSVPGPAASHRRRRVRPRLTSSALNPRL